MASFMDKMQVNSAITKKTKLDLSHQHITTADFMQLVPVMTYEMSPGQKISGSFEAFARLNPLPVPTFGRANIHFNKFFVPYRTLMGSQAWDDFITDSVHVRSNMSLQSGIITSVPLVKNSTFVNLFIDSSAGVININDSAGIHNAMVDSQSLVYEIAAGQVVPSQTPYDFAASQDSVMDPIRYFVFTVKGRNFIKIIESLGYKIVWRILKDNDPKDFTLSAMPLLSLARIYCDWYFPSQYHNLVDYDYLLRLLKEDITLTSRYIVASDIFVILSLASYVQYDSDLFTACFDNPVGPNDGNYSSFNIPDITFTGFADSSNPNYVNQTIGKVVNDLDANGNGTPVLGGGLSSNWPGNDGNIITNYFRNGISQYALNALRSLTDYLTRHRLAGSQAYQRYLARFGVALPFSSRMRSVFCGRDIQPLQIGDVMATADSDGASLGSYAGKGLSYGTNGFEYETNEYGLFVIMMSIVPATGYFQGIDGTLFHRNKLDFFTPEFDSLGCSAVRSSQLFIPQSGASEDTLNVEHIFGYLPRYYELKTKLDRLTGNFRLGSINGSMADLTEFNAANSWHLMRTFTPDDFPNGVNSIVHSPNFLYGASDALQYKRIFYSSDDTAPDNFTLIMNFNLESIAPMASLFDTYEFDDKGSKVTLDVNGQKVN